MRKQIGQQKYIKCNSLRENMLLLSFFFYASEKFQSTECQVCYQNLHWKFVSNANEKEAYPESSIHLLMDAQTDSVTWNCEYYHIKYVSADFSMCLDMASFEYIVGWYGDPVFRNVISIVAELIETLTISV